MRGGGAFANLCSQGIWGNLKNQNLSLRDCSVLNFTERLTCENLRRSQKNAFTLAEVLITLGIIGIVAAMTLPSLINRARSYVLHKQFLKSYANLQQAVLLVKKDLGIDRLRNEYAVYDEKKVYYRSEEFYREFDKHIKVLRKVEPYSIKNYSGNNETGLGDFGHDNPKPWFVLSDGSSVGRYVMNANIRFWVDVNGPEKMPNRYGFDVFEFHITDSTDLVKPVKCVKRYTAEELEDKEWPDIAGYPCSKESAQRLNGMGCAWFALNDVNPDDETKKYWKNLPW